MYLVAGQQGFLCKPVLQELHVGLGRTHDGEVAPEYGRLGGGSRTGLGQMGDSSLKGNRSKETFLGGRCQVSASPAGLPVAELGSETECRDLAGRYRESWGRACFTYCISPSSH